MYTPLLSYREDQEDKKAPKSAIKAAEDKIVDKVEDEKAARVSLFHSKFVSTHFKFFFFIERSKRGQNEGHVER